MSHLSTILNRIKRKIEGYRNNPEELTSDPFFLRLIANTQEYQAMWSDYTQEEADAANILWERYKKHLKPEYQKSAVQLRAEYSDEEKAELMHIQQAGQVVCDAKLERYLTMGTSHRHHKCSHPHGHRGRHRCGECLAEWGGESLNDENKI